MLVALYDGLVRTHAFDGSVVETADKKFALEGELRVEHLNLRRYFSLSVIQPLETVIFNGIQHGSCLDRCFGVSKLFLSLRSMSDGNPN